MNPHAARWLMENAAWAVPVFILLWIAGCIYWAATDGRGLLKHGTRYWRVHRKMARRRFRKETQ